MTLAAVTDLLACPVCSRRDDATEAPLQLRGPSLRCARGHAFDVGRGGAVNLSGAAPPRHADTAAMVAARERFLDSGAYAPLAQAVGEHVRAVVERPVDAVLEAGAGPGWYLQHLLADLATGAGTCRGVALDVSPIAARRAAVRADVAGCRLGAVVADVWGRLPIRSGCLDVVLSVFAPRHPAEFARVLRPGGILVVASALPDHLRTLRDRLGLLRIEPAKDERLDASLATHLVPVRGQQVRFTLSLSASRLADLVAMGPQRLPPLPRRARRGCSTGAGRRRGSRPGRPLAGSVPPGGGRGRRGVGGANNWRI